MIYYSKTTKAKSKQRPEEIMKASKSALPVESQRKHLMSQNIVTTHVKCCLPTKFIGNSAPRVFTGGWSQRHPLPSVLQNSRCPKENKYSAETTLYSLSRHSEPLLLFLQMVENFQKSRFPDASQGPPCKWAFLKIAVSSLLC